MTKKQIIIDGVDVSGCKHLYKEIDCLAHIDFSECCEGYNPSYGYCPNTDCYYKQLKRKEQECEKWKSYYKLYRIETGIVKKVQGVINSNQKYGIEFTEDDIICKDERLSYLEVHEQVKLIIDEQAKELEQLKSENEILKEKLVISSNSDKKTLKIIQTLAEIKEIAEKQVKRAPDGETFARPEIKQILQKISEVENEN